MRKRVISILALLLLLSCLPVAAFAHAVPEEGRMGSITVTMRIGNRSVPGGTLTLYRVGAINEYDGDYSFLPTGAFTGWGTGFEDIQSHELAEELSDYVRAHKLSGTTKKIGTNGKVTFSDLELGLYLLVQNQAADGYYKVKPFLVSVPYLEDGTYIYDVDATTKTELEKRPAAKEPPPTEPTGSKLPQTGQLNWPVPVLAILGLGLFAAGWVLRFRKKDDDAQ